MSKWFTSICSSTFFCIEKLCFSQVTFQVHNDYNCNICAKDPVISNNEKAELKKIDLISPSTRFCTDTEPMATPKRKNKETPTVPKNRRKKYFK